MVDILLFCSCLYILAGCLYLTFATRCVQLRFLPQFFQVIKKSFTQKTKQTDLTVSPYKALFTAMSTTLGMSTIVAPVIAIHLGGPGVMLGFLLTALLGNAATYTEVRLALFYRKKEKHAIMGGPMQYLAALFSARMAKWYALSCLVVMNAWSAAQANQLVSLMGNSLGKQWQIPFSVVVAAFVFYLLRGNIQRIGAFSAKLVPLIFVFYVGSCLWILACNFHKWGEVMQLILKSAFEPVAMLGGIAVGGFMQTLRWGIFKGLQASEAGVGTQAIPHSMADTKNPHFQATLAMLSTYTAGFVAFLSGCVVLVTGTWQEADLLGIGMIASSFQQYFSTFGFSIIVMSALLFSIGTIVGNSYNGSQCFLYLTKNRKLFYYQISAILAVFLGGICSVQTVWSVIDVLLVCMVVPHMTGLIKAVYRKNQATISPEENVSFSSEKTDPSFFEEVI